MSIEYNVVVDGKEIIPSKNIQNVLNKNPRIWDDLKKLYESQNYRDGKITDEELEIIFYHINQGLQIAKEADFEEFGVPYIFDIMKSENYGRDLISNELIIKLIQKMCYFIENDSFDDRIRGRIDFGCLRNIQLIITSNNYADMLLTDEEIDMVLNEDDNDIEWISNGIDTAKMLLGKISSISDKTKKAINEMFDGIDEDEYFFGYFLALLDSEVFRKGKIKEEYLKLIIGGSLGDMNYRFNQLLEIFNSDNYAKGLIPEDYLNLILTTDGVKLCYVLMTLLTSECYMYGFITKDHLEMLVNEKYLAIGYMVERVICRNLDEQEKYSYVLGLLNFDNKEMLCGLCDMFVENKYAKDIEKAAYGYVDYNLMFPSLPKDSGYHVKKRVPGVDIEGIC